MKKAERLEPIFGVLLKILFIPMGTVLIFAILSGIGRGRSQKLFEEIFDQALSRRFSEMILFVITRPYFFLVLGIYFFIFSVVSIVNSYIGFIIYKDRLNYSVFFDYQKGEKFFGLWREIGGVFLSLICISAHFLKISSDASPSPVILGAGMKNLLLIILCCQILAALIIILRSDLLKTTSTKDSSVLDVSKPYRIYKQLSDFKLVDISMCDKRNLSYKLNSLFNNKENDILIELTSGQLICIGVSANKRDDFMELSYGNGEFYLRICLLGSEKEMTLTKEVDIQKVIDDFISNVKVYL